MAGGFHGLSWLSHMGIEMFVEMVSHTDNIEASSRVGINPF